MRDVKYVQVPTVTIFESEEQPGYRSTTNGSYIAFDSFRDDAVSTQRLPSGAHFEPTTYRALFSHGLSRDYEYLYQQGFDRMRRRGQSRPADFTTEVLNRYGCNIYSGLPEVSLACISSTESRLRARIRACDWSIGQSLGEMPETLQFLGEQVKLLTSLFRAIKSADIGKITRAIRSAERRRFERRIAKEWLKKHGYTTGKKAAKDNYLSYQFAWLPLMSDIYNTVKYISEGLATPGVFSAVARGLDPLPPPSLKYGITGVNGYWRSKRGVECSVAYSVANSSLYNLERFGLLDPLAVAWELVPMSFVVDWFIPIGNFIDGITAPFGLTFEHGYRTVYCDWGYEIEYYFEYPLEGGKLPTFGGRLSAMNRQIYFDFPAPVPYFRGFGNLSGGQMLSGLALAVR